MVMVRRRYRYEGGYASTPTPERKKEIDAWLARAAEITASAYATFAPKPDDPPRRACTVCKGTGLETHEGPHAGSCSGCRGFRTVAMTVDEMRAEYKRTRDELAPLLETTPKTIDAMIGSSLPEDASPARWVKAAWSVMEKAKKR